MIETILLSVLIVRTAWRIFLEVLNLLHSTSPQVEIPEVLKDKLTPELLEKSKQYLKDRAKLRILAETTQLVVTIYLVLQGLPRLERLFLRILHCFKPSSSSVRSV